MKIAVGSDHGGFPLKAAVIEAIQSAGHVVVDLGIYSPERADYPDYAEKVGQAILNNEADRGVLLCGSGVGVCIAANKMKGIYASVVHDTYTAHQSVEHDGLNVICMGGRIIGIELAKEIVTTFLSARYSNEERHNIRVAKTRAIEARNH